MTTHDDAPRGTTALAALLNSPELTHARNSLPRWQGYIDNPKAEWNRNNAFPDAVDALAIALKAIDLLLAERPTPEPPKRVWLVKADMVGYDWKGTISAPADLDRKALETHFIEYLTRVIGDKFLGIRTYYDANEPGYEPPTAPAQPSAPAVTVTNTLTPAHYELLDTLLACDIDIDKQAPENVALLRALESHHLVFCYTEDAYGKPCNTYTISSLGETTIRQYQRNTPPAEPVGDLDDLTRAEMQADAAQPEAARAKLSKDDIWFLRQFSGEWRASFGVYRRAKQKQFKGLLDIRKGNGKGMYEYVLTEAGRAALDGAK